MNWVGEGGVEEAADDNSSSSVVSVASESSFTLESERIVDVERDGEATNSNRECGRRVELTLTGEDRAASFSSSTSSLLVASSTISRRRSLRKLTRLPLSNFSSSSYSSSYTLSSASSLPSLRSLLRPLPVGVRGASSDSAGLLDDDGDNCKPPGDIVSAGREIEAGDDGTGASSMSDDWRGTVGEADEGEYKRADDGDRAELIDSADDTGERCADGGKVAMSRLTGNSARGSR